MSSAQSYGVSGTFTLALSCSGCHLVHPCFKVFLPDCITRPWSLWWLWVIRHWLSGTMCCYNNTLLLFSGHPLSPFWPGSTVVCAGVWVGMWKACEETAGPTCANIHGKRSSTSVQLVIPVRSFVWLWRNVFGPWQLNSSHAHMPNPVPCRSSQCQTVDSSVIVPMMPMWLESAFNNMWQWKITLNSWQPLTLACFRRIVISQCYAVSFKSLLCPDRNCHSYISWSIKWNFFSEHGRSCSIFFALNDLSIFRQVHRGKMHAWIIAEEGKNEGFGELEQRHRRWKYLDEMRKKGHLWGPGSGGFFSSLVV